MNGKYACSVVAESERVCSVTRYSPCAEFVSRLNTLNRLHIMENVDTTTRSVEELDPQTSRLDGSLEILVTDSVEDVLISDTVFRHQKGTEVEKLGHAQ